MPPSLIQPCSWTLLMLFASNLFLWEKVSSAPVNVSEAAVSDLKDLFDNATVLSGKMAKLGVLMRKEFFIKSFSSDMFNKFILDLHKNKENLIKSFNSCHTAPINIPETIEDVQKTSFEDFLKMIFHTLLAWKDPLKHLVTELSALPGCPYSILSKAKTIEAKNKDLLEYILRIISMVNPAIKEKEDYPIWSDLDSLQAADKETKFFALYMFSFCLRMDLETLDFLVNFLKCLLLYGDTCYISEF
ncbi:prolactin-7D1-like isoform X2 [Grammomys surdaster]|uniref:prolactin-7D1-like isoform X2 n=1 Tax=Grammomys surdaster TaxID=491861 RepID=UPI00109F88A9|nr:prolactin-7D1-like isoform X2 [Grammomys surdaster]